MSKYSIKFADGRTIGPFLKEQVVKVIVEEKISGKELFKKYPDGEWIKLEECPELVAEFQLQNQYKDDETFIKDIAALSELPLEKIKKFSEKKDESFYHEFQYSKDDEKYEPYFRIEKEVTIEKDIADAILKAEKEQENFERTRALKNQLLKDDKTRILPETLKYREELKNQKKAEKEKPLPEKRIEVFSSSDKTQVISLDQEIENINLNAEINFENILSEEEKQKKIKSRIKEKNQPSPKRRPKYLFLIVILLLVYFLLPDDEKEQKQGPPVVQYGEVVFPQPFAEVNITAAQENFKQAKSFLKKPGFKNYRKACSLLKKSTEHQFKENVAFEYLLYCYAKLLPFTKNKLKSGATLYKLFSLVKNKTDRSLPLVKGISYFYFHSQKFHLVINQIESFLKLGQSPDVEVFYLYLRTLLKIGNEKKAQEVFHKIQNAPQENYYKLLAQYYFYLEQRNYSEVYLIAQKIKDRYQETAESYFLAMDAKIYHQKKDFKKELLAIKKLNFENSTTYYARYFKYTGLYFAYHEKLEEAKKFFEKSLKLQDSDELRNILSHFDNSQATEISALIDKSRAYVDLKNARRFVEEKKWKEAFLTTIEVVDQYPHFIPAATLLAEIQSSQGYYNRAIETLLELRKKFPQDHQVSEVLLNSYIDAYKFSQANLMLKNLSSTSFKKAVAYPLIWARYYRKKNLFLQAVTWYLKRIHLHPLDDKTLAELGEFLFTYRKFPEAKKYLQQAINFNPLAMEYKSLFAQIIYEQDDVDRAIGYLRENLKETPENPVLMSSIALLYLKSGQHKFFQDIQKKLQEDQKETALLYRFLMRSARIEGQDSYEDFARKLIEKEPGDFELRIELGEYLIEKRKYTEALDIFIEIKRRLSTYPRLLYYISKIYLLRGDQEKAIEMAQQEIAANPDIEEGYVLLGRVYIAKKEHVLALQNFKTALQINSSSGEAFKGLAMLANLQGDSKKALDLYKKAVDINPNDIELRLELAYTYKKLGLNKQAVESFEIYLESPFARNHQQIKRQINILK